MFIERPAPKICRRSSGANGRPSRRPLPETLRSAGAPVVLLTGIYKHLAPLEPEHRLVEAESRAM